MEGFADIHTHILPGIDDGSGGVEESVAMLERIARQGIACVAATPHFYANQDNPKDFLRRREAAIEALNKAIAERKDLPRILAGAEIRYFPGMSQWEELEALALEGKRSVLIEMPSGNWTEAMDCELERIYYDRGLIPLIAHIERCASSFRLRGLLKRLEQLPVMVQANTGFFIQKRTRAAALRLLEEGYIHVLGSDCHNLSGRSPNLGEALRVIRDSLGESVLKRIRENAEKLLCMEVLL